MVVGDLQKVQKIQTIYGELVNKEIIDITSTP